MESDDDRLDANVDQYGWHATAIEGGPQPFLYSSGLTASLGHPELAIFGLATDVAHSVITAVIAAIQDGNPTQPGVHLAVGELRFLVRAIHPSQHERYLGDAMAFCRRHHLDLRAMQVFWPDRNGLFPGDAECDMESRDLQPRLDLPLAR